jgi:hypothetical protein
VPKDLLLDISDEAESFDAETVESARNTAPAMGTPKRTHSSLYILRGTEAYEPSTFRPANAIPSNDYHIINEDNITTDLSVIGIDRLKITDEAMVQLRTLSCLTILSLAAIPVTLRALRLFMWEATNSVRWSGPVR